MQVIAVPLESDRSEAQKLPRQFKTAFPVVFDPEMKIAESYGVEAIPHNVAIDRNGKIVKVLVGFNQRELEQMAERLAGEK